MDVQDLKDGLVASVNEFWALNQKPVLLSNLPALLTKRGLNDYKIALKGSSLKSFVSSIAGVDTFEVITHSKHKAKVGLIPPGKIYAFTESQKTVAPPPALTVSNRVSALLDILSGLSAEDLEKVVIPASVLVKLHRQP
ncbi:MULTISPECIES: hypothetical protein [unclassified Pseudomonas]|uniref:hypothetical protein n=1 Tax=unclassified Pseudomonas TaxID=196821 RepID=UPI0035C1BB3B